MKEHVRVLGVFRTRSGGGVLGGREVADARRAVQRGALVTRAAAAAAYAARASDAVAVADARVGWAKTKTRAGGGRVRELGRTSGARQETGGAARVRGAS